MNEEAIKLLYEDIKDSYDVGSLDEFKNYLLDDNKRKMFFDQVIKPKYDVNTIDDFESVYGLKKKDELQSTSQKEGTVSTTKEEGQPISSEYSEKFDQFKPKEQTPIPFASELGKPIKEDKFDYDSFIDLDESEARDKLQNELKGKGYTISETSVGDALLVTDNMTGEKTEIDLQPIAWFGNKKYKKAEIDKVKKLIQSPTGIKRSVISTNNKESYIQDVDIFLDNIKRNYKGFNVEKVDAENVRISKGNNSEIFKVKNTVPIPYGYGSTTYQANVESFSKINSFLYNNMSEEEADTISSDIKIDTYRRLEDDIKKMENKIDVSIESAENDFYDKNYFKGLFSALESSGVSIPNDVRSKLEKGTTTKEVWRGNSSSSEEVPFTKDFIKNAINENFDPETIAKINQYNLDGTINKRAEKIDRAKKLVIENYYEDLPDRERVKEVVRQIKKDSSDKEIEIETTLKLAQRDVEKMVEATLPQLESLSKKYPSIKFERSVTEDGEFIVSSSKEVPELKEIRDRSKKAYENFIALLNKSKYELDKNNSKKNLTAEFLDASKRSYGLIDNAYADFKNAVIQLAGGVAVIGNLGREAIEKTTGLSTGIVSTEIGMKEVRKDMEESRNLVENFTKTKRTYTEAIKEGSFGEFSVRTFSEQAPNIILAVGTSGAGASVGLSNAAISTLVATQFGVTSAGQKYDEITTRQDVGNKAKEALDQLEKLRGKISDEEYFSQKYELERASQDSKISSEDKTLAVIGTGLVEGLVTRFIGTVPNSIKILRDLKKPTNFLDDIFRSNYKATASAFKEFGKSTGGEIIEETSIDLLTQINDYAFLGDQIDLSSLDDVAVTSIITSGAMNAPGTAYSTILTQTNVNRYKNKIKGITDQITALKEMLNDQNLTNIERNYIHNTINNSISGIAEETTNMEADALLLGPKNIQNLITMSGVRNSMLKKAGVENDDSYDIAKVKIDNYIGTLTEDEAVKFMDKMKFIDSNRNDIISSIKYEGAVEKVFGDKGKEIAKNLDPSLTPQQKYVEVYKKVRQDINDNALKEFKDAIQEQTTGQVPVQPETAVSETVEEGTPKAESEVVTEEGIPQEIASLKDDESVLITVKTIDEVPQEFRDRAQESSKTEIKTKKSFFGIPYGPTQKTEVGGGFTYTITGLEAKELATQELQKNVGPQVVTEEGKQEIPEVEAIETVDVSKGFTDYNPQDLKIGEEVYYSFDGKSYSKGKVVNSPSASKQNVYTIENENGVPTVIIYGGERTNVTLKKPQVATQEGIEEEVAQPLRDVETKKDAEALSYKPEEVVETTDAAAFAASQAEAIAQRKDDKLQVTPLTKDNAQKIIDEGGKLFITEDGKAGAYVTADGYMGGLFKQPGANRTQAAKVLQDARIQAGGKFFDAFGINTESGKGTTLEDIYIKNGFRPVARMTFNPEFAPPGWENTNLKNRPDNVFFVYDPTYKATKGEGQRIEDYDQAYELAKNFSPEAAEIESEVQTLRELFKEPEQRKQVENAEKALKAIAPDVKVILHESEQAYAEATGETGRKQKTSGTYDETIVDGKVEKVIHINPDKANARTVAHEAFHAIFLNMVKNDAEAQRLSTAMIKAVYKSAPAELKKLIDNFAESKNADGSNNYDSAVQNEEKLAELIGYLATEYDSLPKPTKNVIKRWLDRLAKIFGLKPFTDNQVIDVLNTIAKKVSTGEAITDQDVAILDKNKSKKEIIKSRKQNFSKASSVEMFENPDILQPKREANGRTKVIELGRAFDKRAKDNGYYIPIPKNGVYTESQLNQIAEAMTDDAELQLLQDDSGIGWYDLKTRSAMELMSRIHPELSDSNSKPYLEFTLMVALISQNNSVGINFRQANEAYTYYKNNNKLPNKPYAGKSGNIIKQNIALAFEAIKKKGWEKYKNTLQETKTVKEWEAEGYKVNGENKTTKITGAMAMLGSKIGSFWGNLNGDFNTLTADLWFSRMFNRYTGNVVAKKASEKSKQTTLDELKKYEGKTLLNGYKKSDILKGGEVFDKWLNTIVKDYADGGYKDKQRLNIVSNTHFKNTNGELQDIPRGGQERNTMRNVVKRVQDKLIERGYPKLDIADIQAIVWYNEKDLYRQYKAVNKSSEKTDYETAAQEVLREQGVNAEVALPFKTSKSSADGGRNQTDRIQPKSLSEKVDDATRSRKQATGRPSIDNVIKIAKENNISDAAIRKFLQDDQGMTTKQADDAVKNYNEVQRRKGLKVEGVKDPSAITFFGKEVLSENNLKKMYQGLLFLKSARANQPKSMFIGKEDKAGAVEGAVKRAYNTLNKLDRITKKLSKKDLDNVMAELDSYLRGNKEAKLPDNIKKIAFEMRTHLDYLSKKLVEVGAVPDVSFDELSPKKKKELIEKAGSEAEAREDYKSAAENILGNVGEYLNRSFAVHTDKNWKDKVSEKVVEDAKAYLRKSMAKSIEAKAIKENKDFASLLEQEVNAVVDRLLDPNESKSFFNTANASSKNTGILKQKQDIAPEILALMGEQTSPAMNYIISVQKIASLAAQQTFLNNVREKGLGVFLFENEADAPKGFRVKIASEGSKTMNPLNGMYTSPEIAKALNETYKKPEGIIKVVFDFINFLYLKPLGAVKYSKTILSPGTHSKNIIGNGFFMLANGYLNPKDWADAGIVVWNEIKSGDNDALNNKYIEYIEAGVINSSATLNDLKRTLSGIGNKVESEEEFERRVQDRLYGKNIIKKGLKGAEKAYQLEDDYFKIISYEVNKRQYAKALFKNSFENISDKQKQEVIEIAKEVTKNTLPNYERIAAIRDALKILPFGSNFLSFHMEALRTSYNTIDLAFKEIKDPRTAAIGARRLAGISAVIMLSTGVIGNLLGGGDDEDEKEDAIRKLLPHWSENSNIRIVSTEGENIVYQDLSASSPYGAMEKAMNAYNRGEDISDSLKGTFDELFGAFYADDIIVSQANKYNEVVSSQGFTSREGKEALARGLYETFKPGGLSSDEKIFIDDRMKLIDAAFGRKIELKKEGKVGEAVGQFSGYGNRIVKKNAVIKRKLYEIGSAGFGDFKSGKARSASTDYNNRYRDFLNGKVSEDEVEKAYDRSNLMYKEAMKEAIEIYKAALILDINYFDMEDMMKETGFSKKEIELIDIGETPELKRKGENDSLSPYQKLLKRKSKR